jgi:hypothetical protein
LSVGAKTLLSLCTLPSRKSLQLLSLAADSMP